MLLTELEGLQSPDEPLVASGMNDLDTDELPDDTDRHGDGVTRDEKKLLHYEVTRSIIGGLYRVHTGLGVGFSEGVYANALSVELRAAGLVVQREVPFDVTYRGVVVGRYRADMIVESKVIVEAKALRRLDESALNQLRNYLRASGLSVGLLLNFGSTAEHKRVILTSEYAHPWRPTRNDRRAPA